ncbi:SDR family NAD(P)-dependent oxidoreductase [Labilibacter sediminis]|nr:SDR family NAD(P)-dependent oxidoreductase [Labilibacter sediminis]
MKTNKIYALVTGAGKGLGKAIASELAQKGHHLLLIAREGENLSDLSCYLSLMYKVDVRFLEIDFLNENALKAIEEWILPYNIDILVNNAGIGGSTFFDHSDLPGIDAILQVNVRTLALLTRLVVYKLQQQTTSYILNVASMASFCPIAYKTVYPASKAFVYSFSKGLALELKDHGVHVCILSPGPIKTNAEVSKRIEQQGWWVKAGLWSPEKLASMTIRKMFNGQKVIIPGLINKLNWALLKILPTTISIPIVSKAVKNEIYMVNQASPYSMSTT